MLNIYPPLTQQQICYCTSREALKGLGFTMAGYTRCFNIQKPLRKNGCNVHLATYLANFMLKICEQNIVLEL